MAKEPETTELPRHVAYYRQAKDLAMGVHPRSKQASIALLFMDALLTSLIITYVSCTMTPYP
jgi:alpha-1,3-mannosyltransferase